MALRKSCRSEASIAVASMAGNFSGGIILFVLERVRRIRGRRFH